MGCGCKAGIAPVKTPQECIDEWNTYILAGPIDKQHDGRKHHLRTLARLGIPSGTRREVWLWLAGPTTTNTLTFEQLEALNPNSGGSNGASDYGMKSSMIQEMVEQIDRDLNRTYPDDARFEAAGGSRALRRILHAYCVHARPDIGYCQGMNYVAGFLLRVYGGRDDDSSLSDVYRVFQALAARHMASFYVRDLAQLPLDCHILDALLRGHNKQLARHLQAMEVNAVLYFPKWILTAYTLILTDEQVMYTWDLFLLDGVVALFQAALALLHLFTPDVLALQEFWHILQFLQGIPDKMTSVPLTTFQQAIHTCTIHPRDIRKEHKRVLKRGLAQRRKSGEDSVGQSPRTREQGDGGLEHRVTATSELESRLKDRYGTPFWVMRRQT